MLEIYRILKFVAFLPSVAAIKPEEKNHLKCCKILKKIIM
jgi:hypothetical protein